MTVNDRHVFEEKLQSFNGNRMDASIYGCTHLPLLQANSQQALRMQITLVDAGAATAQFVKDQLIAFDGLSDAPKARTWYFTTGDPIEFRNVAGQWLENKMIDVSNIKLGD